MSDSILAKIELQHAGGLMVEFYMCKAVSVHRSDDEVSVILSFCDGGRLDWYVDNTDLGHGWAGHPCDAIRLTVAGHVVDLADNN